MFGFKIRFHRRRGREAATGGSHRRDLTHTHTHTLTGGADGRHIYIVKNTATTGKNSDKQLVF